MLNTKHVIKLQSVGGGGGHSSVHVNYLQHLIQQDISRTVRTNARVVRANAREMKILGSMARCTTIELPLLVGCTPLLWYPRSTHVSKDSRSLTGTHVREHLFSVVCELVTSSISSNDNEVSQVRNPGGIITIFEQGEEACKTMLGLASYSHLVIVGHALFYEFSDVLSGINVSLGGTYTSMDMSTRASRATVSGKLGFTYKLSKSSICVVQKDRTEN